MEFDPDRLWYHGSPLKLTTLFKGSTITQKLELARVFSHKPTIVSISDDGQIKHNGKMPGYLYIIAEKVQAEDVTPHPQTTMEVGGEWLTRRELRLQFLHTIEPVPGELLTDEDIAVLMERMAGKS